MIVPVKYQIGYRYAYEFMKTLDGCDEAGPFPPTSPVLGSGHRLKLKGFAG
jgi:hypothetical protein